MFSLRNKMNRSTKFRVWLENEKKMVYPRELILGELLRPDDYFMSMNGDFCTPGTGGFIPIENVKTLWSTGFHDKGGKEIYEGDIVQGGFLNKVKPTPIYWDTEEARFYFEGFENCWESDGFYNSWKELEVIGNIYENTDLLGYTLFGFSF